MGTENIIATLLQEDNQVLSLSIDLLNLSPRVRHCLLRADINTIGKIVRNWNFLSSVKNLGAKSLSEILDKLQSCHSENKNHLPWGISNDLLSGLVKEKTLFDDFVNKPEVNDHEKYSNIPIEVLDLSIRAYNSLKRKNINTVDQVYQQWEEICLFKNIGPATRAEIRTALDAFQLSSHDDKEAQDIARNSIDQLQLSNEIRSLLKKRGLYTIDQITPTKLKNLKLKKLLALETVIDIQDALWKWKNQGELNSHCQRVRNTNQVSSNPETVEDVKASVHFQEVDFEDYFDEFMRVLKPRYVSILEFRFGLRTGTAVTLGETAEYFGVTRERIRQIEFLGMGKLRENSSEFGWSPLILRINEIIDNRGGFISETRLIDELKATLELKVYSLERIFEFTKKLFQEEIKLKRSNIKLKYIYELGGWSTTSWDMEQILQTESKIHEILSMATAPMQWMDLYTALTREDGLMTLEEPLAHAITLGMSDNEQIKREIDGGWSKNGKETRLFRIIAIMNYLGQPAHFSEIAEQYNQTYDDQPLTEHHIHGFLAGRKEFRRVGRGKYGLREWGLHDDGNIANAVRRVLTSYKHPMDISDITDQVLKTWEVSRGSVLVAIEADARFSKTKDSKIWLTEWGLNLEKRIKRDDEARVDRLFVVLKEFGQPMSMQQIIVAHNQAHPERPLTIAAARYTMRRKKVLFTHLGSDKFALAEWGLQPIIEDASRDRKREIIDIINEHGPIHINDLYELYIQKNADSPISRHTLNMYLSSLRHLISKPQKGVYELRALEYEIG